METEKSQISMFLIVTYSTYNKGHMMSGSVSNDLDELTVQVMCKSAEITNTHMDAWTEGWYKYYMSLEDISGLDIKKFPSCNLFLRMYSDICWKQNEVHQWKVPLIVEDMTKKFFHCRF